MGAVSTLVDKVVTYIVNPAILLVFAAGFMVFMYGLVKFIWHLQSGEVTSEGKKHMLWGIVGMFIMVSVYGIIQIIDTTFGFGAISGNGPSTDVNRANSVKAPPAFK